MQVKYLILLTFILSFSAYAKSNPELGKLESYCRDSRHLNISEKVTDEGSDVDLFYFFIKIKDPQTKQMQIFDCSYFGVGPVSADKYKLDTYSGQLICSLPNSFPGLSKVLKLEKEVAAVKEQLACKPSEKTPILSSQCGKQLGCNLLRSFLNISTLGTYGRLAPLLQKDTGAKKSCLNARKSDCLTEVGAGILKNLWSNIEGLGYLAKAAASYAWNGVKSFGRSLFGYKDTRAVENKSSEAMHMASGESKLSIAQFRSNPGQFMVNLGNKIYTYLMKTVQQNFGCAKWSGAPHTSKCVKPLESWECSSCDQRINSICGVLGFAGGEIVTAFFTGGTINLLGKAGRATKVAKAFSSLGKAAKGSRVVAATAKVGGFAGHIVSYPFKVLAGIPGLKQYLHANEVAFMYGLKGGRAAEGVQLASKATKLKAEEVIIPPQVKPYQPNTANTKPIPQAANEANFDEFADIITPLVLRSEKEVTPGKWVIVDHTIDYVEATQKLIGTRLRAMPDNVRNDFLKLFKEIPDPSKQKRYLGLLINSRNPEQSLARIKLLEAGENPTKIIAQIDEEISVVSLKLERAENLSEAEKLATAKARSQLLQERFLIESGDNIEVTRIFHAESHNKDISGIGHSLDDSLSLDIKVRKNQNGEPLYLCRGSYGTREALSGVSGGFMTLCRESGYLQRTSITEFVAAPTDVKAAFPGYDRFSRFEIKEGTEITFGLNGKVIYDNGSGGVGGGIEFYTSRLGQAVPESQLAASVRIPVCSNGNANCAKIFDTQAAIRQGDLEKISKAQATSLLNSAENATQKIIEQTFSPSALQKVITEGGDSTVVLNRYFKENPELTSAFNLNREIELKKGMDFTTGKRIVDEESAQLLQYSGMAKSARTPIGEIAKVNKTPEAIKASMGDFYKSNPLIQEFQKRNTEINQLFAQLKATTVPTEQVQLLQQISNLRGQQSDLMIGIKSMDDALRRAVAKSDEMDKVRADLLRSALE